MNRRTTKIPSYRFHKASGQAVVTLSGRDRYLGVHNSPASRAMYGRLINEWLAQEKISTVPHDADKQATVSALIVAFWSHAERYYRKNGKPTGEIQALRYSLRPLQLLYGTETVDAFGPKKLKAVRQHMIDAHLARTLINKRINRIRHVFKWGVENELVPSMVLDGLKAVAPLKKGRTDAKESKPVKPVDSDLIKGLEKFVSPQVWTMVQLQLRTAMRPGEVVQMRRGGLDTTGEVWIYTPNAHKNEHHGQRRLIYLGPEAKNLVKPYLDRPADAFLFSPREAENARLAARHVLRITPISCGNRPRSKPPATRKRQPKDHYDVDSYRRAITRGCDRAFAWPGLGGRKQVDLGSKEKQTQQQWRDAHRWHPHQLRHNAATFLRREFGVEAARLILGHRSIAVTELYAELNHEKALDIMSKVG